VPSKSLRNAWHAIMATKIPINKFQKTRRNLTKDVIDYCIAGGLNFLFEW